MARINQGCFTNLTDSYENLRKEYQDVTDIYFTDGGWNCMHDFFTEFSYSANDVYVNSRDLKKQIDNLLMVSKFEIKNKCEKYKEFSHNCELIKTHIKDLFDNTLSAIRYSSGIGEKEQETLEKFDIYNES